MSFFFGVQPFGVSPFGGRLTAYLSDLLTDGEINPQQILNFSPVFTWNYRHAFNIEQSAYQLQVSSGSSFTTTIWDTGEIESTNKAVVYNGPELSKSVPYYWRVRAKDDLLWTSYQSANFRINDSPTVADIAIDGRTETIIPFPVTPPPVGTDSPPDDPYNEKLFTNETKPTISWTYTDPDGNPQVSFSIRIGLNGNFNVYKSGTIFSAQDEYQVTEDLERGKEYVAEVTVFDGAEYATGTKTFTLNGLPVVANLLVDGKADATDIISDNPVFSWDYTDVDGNPQFLRRIRIGTSEGTSDIWDSEFVEGWQNFATYSGQPLPPRVTLYARVDVQDRPGGQSNVISTTFLVNRPPNKPTITYPAGGEELDGDTSITVQWTPASPIDPDGDPVTYKLEITDSFQSNTGWELVADGIAETATSYVLDLSTYPKDYTYGLRLIVSDGLTTSEPAATNSFFSILNHKPNMPVLQQPTGGLSQAFSTVIRWTVPEPLDVDGDEVQFVVEYVFMDDPNPTGVVLAVLDSDQSLLNWNLTELKDGNYQVRIKAVDVYGKESDYSTSETFTIDNVNESVDIVEHNGNIIISQNNGKVFRTVSNIWNFEEQFDFEKIEELPFDSYKDPGDITGAFLKDGHLIITTGSGETFVVEG